MRMRYGLMVLGLVGLMVVGFVMLPAEKVNEFVLPATGPSSSGWASFANAPGPALPRKSGLRIAVEGRLKWLGIEISDPVPNPDLRDASARASYNAH
jgi:hypothetical protein